MKIIKTITEFREWRETVKSVAFVPTMGNLHDGHLQLVREAKKHADKIVVSIYVNRMQFGEGEDFDQYPRTLQQDAEKLEQEGVDVIFSPSEQDLACSNVLKFEVIPPRLATELCGKTRPIHFKGVVNIIVKLFNIVDPDIACFGKKDYQQLVILQGLVSCFNFNVRIIPVEIQRAENGLALSSRNQYLSNEERNKAPELYQTLLEIRNEILNAQNDIESILAQATNHLNDNGWEVEYIELRDAKNLSNITEKSKSQIILVAAKLGETRLIDNLEIIL